MHGYPSVEIAHLIMKIVKLPHPPKEKAPFALDAVIKSFTCLKSILLEVVYFLHLKNLQIIFIFFNVFFLIFCCGEIQITKFTIFTILSIHSIVLCRHHMSI